MDASMGSVHNVYTMQKVAIAIMHSTWFPSILTVVRKANIEDKSEMGGRWESKESTISNVNCCDEVMNAYNIGSPVSKTGFVYSAPY